jgi:ribonucleoside-diphosphate reductase alpha chain
MVRFEDVKGISTEEYFNGNQFSIDAFEHKYAIFPGETYVEALKRVCDYIASAEKTAKEKKYWSERWFDEIYNDWWHPAGSIMQGAANPKNISLCNCTTLSLGTGDEENEWDSLEGIIRGAAYTTAKAAAYRQGLGIDFSRIRPKNTTVHNSSNKSEGVVHWMKFIDSIGYYVGQSGRIPAFLFSLRGDHPDILEFIEVKKDYTKIQNANISVQFDDRFYQAVENDADWELKFEIPEVKAGDRIYVDEYIKTADAQQDEDGKWYVIAKKDRPKEVVYKKIKARKLLRLIAENMYRNAEPGIQNIDIARKYSNSDAVYDPKRAYDSRIWGTNACSEEFLSRDSLCVLSSINAGRFSIEPEKYGVQLKKISESIVRFLDNVNSKELEDHRYATPLQAESIKALRRIGAGVTNLAGLLFKADLEYGSNKSIEFISEFIQKYNFELYKSTVALGEEKGSFGLFDPIKIKKSVFIQKMIQEGINFTSMRNVTVSSIAPTGTLSLMFRDMVMGTGVEPPFGLYYWKRTRMSGEYKYYFCVPHIVRKKFNDLSIGLPIDSDTIEDTWDGKNGKKIVEIIEANKDKISFKGSMNIDPMDKLKLVSEIAKHIDSSVSVTFMLSDSSTVEDVEKFILEAHKRNLKSIAAFPDKKMYGIVSFIPFKELAFKLKAEGIELHQQNFSKKEQEELSVGDKIVVSSAPKRPKELDAEIFSVSVKGEKFIIAIGLLNGAPYEMFGGAMNGLRLTSNKTGKIIKLYRNKYKLVIDGGIEIADFSETFDPVEQVLFRLVSSNLRHGTPVKFICEQLHKATSDMSSLARAAARVLKKYIRDGEIAHGLKCPMCGASNLIYQDGCASCSCGFSKCD